ncbi:carbohydrate deacetylase [Vagococcus hydrophili]|uniref:Carbohydrate deacetylase n=1 Tax=Vagococcus hydrophili TaxID=2714947 RepID=A0A6G8AVK8_9ENTE|nr:carbohydrate deacetylase [Vagococcus hydrophili]QIL49027.1 carbohydrate deacetylase [Vagococcus hydrophili]
MAKLVINADDFGYSKAINHGIIDSFQNGVLTSTTLMANMPGFDHAVELSRSNPNLGVGVHLSMTCGKPILTNVTDLVEETGKFKCLDKIKAELFETNLEQLYDEWDAQIKHIQQAGINISHLDSHHYTHSMGDHYRVVEALSLKYHLPIRNSHDVRTKFINPNLSPAEELWPLFNYPEMKRMDKRFLEVKQQLFKIIVKDCQKYSEKNKVEAVCHPGFLDEEVWFGSSFNLARMREVSILCDLDLSKLFSEYEFELCNYHDF